LLQQGLLVFVLFALAVEVDRVVITVVRAAEDLDGETTFLLLPDNLTKLELGIRAVPEETDLSVVLEMA
jgi:hypothetical protein